MNNVKVMPPKSSKTTSPEDVKTEPILVSFTPKEQLSQVPNLEDRLHRLNVLFDLQRKYNQLQASLQKLNTFQLTHDSESGYIVFKDENRNEFSTGNVEVTKEFLAFVKATIQKKIKEIEPLLVW